MTPVIWPFGSAAAGEYENPTTATRVPVADPILKSVDADPATLKVDDGQTIAAAGPPE
jgi:hypothetical protein